MLVVSRWKIELGSFYKPFLGSRTSREHDQNELHLHVKMYKSIQVYMVMVRNQVQESDGWAAASSLDCIVSDKCDQCSSEIAGNLTLRPAGMATSSA